MEILDQKDLGSGGSAEAASAATIRTKLDARLQLETVSRMHTFVQANTAGGVKLRVHTSLPDHGSGSPRGIAEQDFLVRRDARGANCSV